MRVNIEKLVIINHWIFLFGNDKIWSDYLFNEDQTNNRDYINFTALIMGLKKINL